MPDRLHDELEETGNISAYLRQAARERLHRYRQARETLRASGWNTSDLRAVIDVLNGTKTTFPAPLGEQIAASMEDAAELNAVHETRGIDRERWDTLTEQVREREPIARSLNALATEYWGDARAHVEL
jgi:predicted RNA-binding Zn ribbon-like protein